MPLPSHHRPLPARRRGLVAVAALLAALWLLPALAAAAEVSYLVMPVQVKRKDATEWRPLNLGDQVFEGDAVRTGMGARVEVLLADKRVFRIGQATEVEVSGLDTRGGGLKARFKLVLGRFWGTLVNGISETAGERFQVATTTATIGVKGTSFGVDYDKADRESRVAVVTGRVAAIPPPAEVQAPTEIAGPREIAPPQEVTRAQWEVIVSRDQKLIIRPGEAPRTEPLTDEDKRDPWLVFNAQRDALLR